MTPTPTLPPWLEPGGAITVANVARIRALGRLDAPGMPSTVFAYAFSPDSARLAALNNEQLLAWNLVDGKLIFSTARLDATQVYYSPDKTEIYTLGDDGVISVYDAETGVKQNDLKGHLQFSNTAAFYADEGWLALGGTDGDVKVWDTAGRQSLVTFRAQSAPAIALVFSPDGERLATAGQEGVVYVWDWRASQQITAFDHQGALAIRMAFSPDGGQLAVGTSSYIALWSLANRQLDYVLQTGDGGVSDVLAYTPDGRYIVNGGAIPDMMLWDPQTGERVALLPGIGGDRLSAAFSPDGGLMLVSVLNKGVTLWDLTRITGETVNRADLDVGSVMILYADWTPDGFLMTFFDATGPIHVWGVPKG